MADGDVQCSSAPPSEIDLELLDWRALHRQACAGAQSLIDTITAADLDRPSPCEGWTVRDVLAHMINGHRMVAAKIAGQPVVGDPDPVGDQPGAAYARATEAAVAAFDSEAALNGEYTMPWGPVPGRLWIRYRTNDQVVHTWDLARALGRPTDGPPFDDALCNWCQEVSRRRLGDGPRDPSLFSTPTVAPSKASAADRLVAFLGRRV